MNGFKVDIVSKHIIKPSTLTPESKRILKLSLLDQMTPQIYGTGIFFFSPDAKRNPSDMFRSLRDSLSQVLPKFYPMAGQVKDPSTIECNDEGAYFIEAHVNCKMEDMLKKPDMLLLNKLHSTDKDSVESCSNAVIIFQFNIFDCGGVAITTSISHKLGDINMLLALLKAWTTTSRGDGGGNEEVMPEFIGGSLLPHKEELMIPDLGVFMEPSKSQRFVFQGDKIAALKAKIEADGGGEQASSKVEVVLAIILKNAVEASREVVVVLSDDVHDDEPDTPAIFFQTVNIRSMMKPPLSKYSVGNLLWQYPVFIEEKEIKLHEIVAGMRKEMKEMREVKAAKLKGEEGFMEVMKTLGEWAFHFITNKDIFRCTSWCRSGLYEVDFGWGKPIWVCGVTPQMRNIIVLIDTKDGNGVEAWISLDEKEMAIFEKKEELFEFAQLNPNVQM
ncbi:acyltransferase Pun1-like [Impatiens glandulifera]|uniref:acyltransferase Pun1-like n=1 Tax=Impatiens glandulifera TaxID=253017 RepID=UPI001FB05602|nr:acyltransferase Pun1-like [Impatiens glandulifera]